MTQQNEVKVLKFVSGAFVVHSYNGVKFRFSLQRISRTKHCPNYSETNRIEYSAVGAYSFKSKQMI